MKTFRCLNNTHGQNVIYQALKESDDSDLGNKSVVKKCSDKISNESNIVYSTSISFSSTDYSAPSPSTSTFLSDNNNKNALLINLNDNLNEEKFIEIPLTPQNRDSNDIKSSILKYDKCVTDCKCEKLLKTGGCSNYSFHFEDEDFDTHKLLAKKRDKIKSGKKLSLNDFRFAESHNYHPLSFKLSLDKKKQNNDHYKLLDQLSSGFDLSSDSDNEELHLCANHRKYKRFISNYNLLKKNLEIKKSLRNRASYSSQKLKKKSNSSIKSGSKSHKRTHELRKQRSFINYLFQKMSCLSI